MEKEDLKQKAEEFLNDKDLPQKIETFPSLISQKTSLIAKLENKVKEAKKAAEDAKGKADNLKGFQEKRKFFGLIKWKSGKAKDYIEDTQEATKGIASATKLNSEALELTLKFEEELANTAEFLFYLGCYNIATNEAMIADLNEQLRKDDIEVEDKRIKLSAEVKEKFKNVVKRLQAQQDVLYRQEKLKKKSKQHGKAIARNIDQLNDHESRLKEKDRIDQEQTDLINGIKETLNQMDDELSGKIKKLIQSIEEKTALDKEQTSEIEKVREKIELVYTKYNKLRNYVIIGFVVTFLIITGCIIVVVAYFF